MAPQSRSSCSGFVLASSQARRSALYSRLFLSGAYSSFQRSPERGSGNVPAFISSDHARTWSASPRLRSAPASAAASEAFGAG